ncbi:MAG TPA: molybdopterin cofactor-binding domain-containing protein [Chryseolinea sp.]|nr:molybdopterin cofactor-binding domain-containing protein [Chryseolinea sp.]
MKADDVVDLLRRSPEHGRLSDDQQHEQEAPALAMRRRTFLRIMGNGLAVFFAAANSPYVSAGTSEADEGDLDAWIHIGENSRITVFTGKVEVGQNIRTSLAQIVAEELDAPLDSIEMVMGDTSLTPYDRGTFGSRSVPFMGPQLRTAAATARMHLLGLAARAWKVSSESLTIDNGKVYHAVSERSATFGTLTRGQKMLERVRDNVAVKPVSEWKIAGKAVAKINGENFITGRHRYVSDMLLPDMLYGKVLRPDSYGAILDSVDTSEAERIPQVRVVRDGDFIGICAPSHRVAQHALKLVKATWKPQPHPSRDEIFDYLKARQERGGDAPPPSLNITFSSAPIKVEQSFTVDYIAHAPLEPRAGLAQWTNDSVTVWTGTQRPFGVQEELAEIFRLPKDKIRVIMPDTGSGYGGKHSGEAGIEAARLSKAAGKPVKVVWTREEEFTWAYFRPAGIIDVRAGVSHEGQLLSWEFHNYNSGGSGIESPYEVAARYTQYHPCESPLRQGSYRGLAATANTFARECTMDDLARKLKMDPLLFRLRNLKDERMIAVLNAAAEKFGWRDWKQKPHHGIGLACGEEKGGVVATCAEVHINADNGQLKVVRVSIAFECGAIINPMHLENQIAGSVIQGLGGALFESIDFRDGKILNPSFSTYRVPRFSDVPTIDVVMLNRKDRAPAGAGETPIVGIAPAVRNAIAHAIGKSLYTLPLQREEPE